MEVVRDSFDATSSRIIRYLGLGVKRVVIIDAETQSMHVYGCDGAASVKVFGNGQKFELPDFLPGFSVVVGQVLKPILRKDPPPPRYSLFDRTTEKRESQWYPDLLQTLFLHQSPKFYERDVEIFAETARYDMSLYGTSTIAGPLRVKIEKNEI